MVLEEAEAVVLFQQAANTRSGPTLGELKLVDGFGVVLCLGWSSVCTS